MRSYDAIHDFENRRLGLVGKAETITADKI